MTDRCTDRVPPVLNGGMKGPNTPSCERDAGHGGKHRCKKHVRGVGTTSWEWRTQPPETPRAFRVPNRGDVMTRARLRRGGRGGDGEPGKFSQAIKCKCPPEKVGILHLAPCPLTGLVR